ncbi:hypothetical protein FOFC_19462 [Fusarium oxysporum]|nr:hypothetical protein FOFC_19462 [Fusarium oxysporum]
MRRRATTRARLINAKVVEIIILYLIMDSAMSGPPPQNYLITREKQTLLRLSNLSLGDMPFRFFSTHGYWFITFICNRLNHACAAVTSLFIGLSHSEDWPHLNGPISAWSPAKTFDGKFWHQLYRKTFTGLGDFVPDKIFCLRRNTLLSRYTRLFLTFLKSGLIHHCIARLNSFAANETFTSKRFYALHAIGIIFEDDIQAITTDVPILVSVRQVVGYI